MNTSTCCRPRYEGRIVREWRGYWTEWNARISYETIDFETSGSLICSRKSALSILYLMNYILFCRQILQQSKTPGRKASRKKIRGKPLSLSKTKEWVSLKHYVELINRTRRSDYKFFAIVGKVIALVFVDKEMGSFFFFISFSDRYWLMRLTRARICVKYTWLARVSTCCLNIWCGQRIIYSIRQRCQPESIDRERISLENFLAWFVFIAECISILKIWETLWG